MGNVTYICAMRYHSIACYEYPIIILYCNERMLPVWKEIMASLSSSSPGNAKEPLSRVVEFVLAVVKKKNAAFWLHVSRHRCNIKKCLRINRVLSTDGQIRHRKVELLSGMHRVIGPNNSWRGRALIRQIRDEGNCTSWS